MNYDQLGQPLRLHHQSGWLPFFRQPFTGSKDIICRKEQMRNVNLLHSLGYHRCFSYLTRSNDHLNELSWLFQPFGKFLNFNSLYHSNQKCSKVKPKMFSWWVIFRFRLQRYNIFLIYTRPWSRKMHFFIRFREQGRATAHDFVVAHVEKKQYLCRRNWRSMTALLRNLYNCLNSSSPHRTHCVSARRGPQWVND